MKRAALKALVDEYEGKLRNRFVADGDGIYLGEGQTVPRGHNTPALFPVARPAALAGRLSRDDASWASFRSALAINHVAFLLLAIEYNIAMRAALGEN